MRSKAVPQRSNREVSKSSYRRVGGWRTPDSPDLLILQAPTRQYELFPLRPRGANMRRAFCVTYRNLSQGGFGVSLMYRAKGLSSVEDACSSAEPVPFDGRVFASAGCCRYRVGHARLMGDEAVRGPVLKRGDLVRLVSPSSPPDRSWLAESVRVLEGWGLRVDLGRHVLGVWGYMAGRDDDRLADLNDALGDPMVRAIIATRGGAGAYRIVDGIDFDAVRADPKPLVGFSDITNLHVALWTHTRLATVHGCFAGPNATAGVRDLLMTVASRTINRNPGSLSSAVEVPGRAVGPLVDRRDRARIIRRVP